VGLYLTHNTIKAGSSKSLVNSKTTKKAVIVYDAVVPDSAIRANHLESLGSQI
jgi:hypothetical protein